MYDLIENEATFTSCLKQIFWFVTGELHQVTYGN